MPKGDLPKCASRSPIGHLTTPPTGFFEEVSHALKGDHALALRKLIEQYAGIFYRSRPLKQTGFTEHQIELTDACPFQVSPYRYSPEKKQAIREQVRELLRDG